MNRIHVNNAQVQTSVAFVSQWTDPMSVSFTNFTYTDMTGYHGHNALYWISIGI